MDELKHLLFCLSVGVLTTAKVPPFHSQWRGLRPLWCHRNTKPGSPGQGGGEVSLYWHKYCEISLKQDGLWASQRLFLFVWGCQAQGRRHSQWQGQLQPWLDWLPKAAPLKDHFVFPIRTPALITYHPNRQINELKATLLEKGSRRGEGRWGEQLLAVLALALGFRLAVINESTHSPWPPLGRLQGRHMWRINYIAEYKQLKGTSRCRYLSKPWCEITINSNLEWRKELRCH